MTFVFFCSGDGGQGKVQLPGIWILKLELADNSFHFRPLPDAFAAPAVGRRQTDNFSALCDSVVEQPS